MKSFANMSEEVPGSSQGTSGRSSPSPSRSGSVGACSSYRTTRWWDALRDEQNAETSGDLVYFCLSLYDSKIRKMNKAWFEKVHITHESAFAMARRAAKTIHYLSCMYKVGKTPRLVSACSAWHAAVVDLAHGREKSGPKHASTTVLDSPVLVQSILLLERAMNQTNNGRRNEDSEADGGIPPELKATVISRFLECTFVGPDSEEAATATDGGTQYDGSFYTEGDEDGGDDGDGDSGLASGKGSKPPSFAFSTAGDFPYAVSLVNEFMWWNFPSSRVEPCNSQASKSSGAYMIYQAIGQLLKQLHKSLRTNPGVTRSTFMTVLLIFRSLLKQFPILSTDFIAGLHDAILPYLRWPQPYGAAAAKMLSVLEAEAKSPGVTLRNWHMSCRPLLSARGRRLVAAGSVSAANMKLWNRIGSTVYLYFDSQSPLACTFAELIRQVNGDDAVDDIETQEESTKKRSQMLDGEG